MRQETQIIHAVPVDKQTGSISVPIYQTSTFVQEAPGVNQGFDYSRSNNPTRQVLEELVANLEGGEKGVAFSSGLAAVDAVVKLLTSGDKILAVNDIYGGSYRLFETVYSRFGIQVDYIDTADFQTFSETISDEYKLVWLESPTNPTLKVSDIKAITRLSHQYGALVVVDNTFASPILQRPIELGADIVLHSSTKYLSGHSDIIGGVVVTKLQALGDQIKYIQNATGAVPGPFDCWLAIRGIETAHLRVYRQSENALCVAQFLEQHDEVAEVHYPGLKSHQNHEIARKQQSAFGGVVSFSLHEDTVEAAKTFVQKTKLFKLAESLGGVKSLLCHPATMTHKSTPDYVRRNAGIRDSLIRLSCGIEHPEDLIQDVNWALSQTKSVSSQKPVTL